MPAARLAEALGDTRVANMVMLGALLQLAPLVSPASIIEALAQTVSKRYQHLIPLNEQALAAGAQTILEQQAVAGSV